MGTNPVINSLLPVFALMGIGVVLRRYNITTETFLKTSDRLVYYIFFPAMLFWKIGAAESSGEMNLNYCIASLVTIFLVFALSLIGVRLFGISNFGAGTFSQSCYRFNTYIGMAIIMNAFGSEGIRYFGIMISMSIPFINVMAVSTLIWYSGMRIGVKQRVLMMLKALVSNPLILSCVAGIIYSRGVGTFPVFVANTLQLLTSVALPLGLLSIGGELSFKGVREYLKVSVIAAVIRLVIMPLIGYCFLVWLDVSGIVFKVSMVFFTLPTATSIYILSSQLNSDTEMASATILISTLFSFFTLSVVLMM